MTITRKAAKHNLKIWPEFYAAVCAGEKRAELRLNDRDYHAGDTLSLCEWDKNELAFTGDFIDVTVTHVADVGEWMPGYVLLSIALASLEAEAKAPVVDEHPAYEVGTFGKITINWNGHSLDFDLSDFDFKDGAQCKRDGGFIWKKGLQGIINAIQKHNDSLHSGSIHVVPVEWNGDNHPTPVVTSELLDAAESIISVLDEYPDQLVPINRNSAVVRELRAAMQGKAELQRTELTVWYGSMPETNGKTNWTAMLHRKGQHPFEGITIDCSEYPDRVRYEADRMRQLIGELVDEPDILSYDAEAHSGYVYPGNSPVIKDGWKLVPVELTVAMRKAFHKANDECEQYVSPDHQWEAMLAAAPQQESE